MKKLFTILLLVPFYSFGQTFIQKDTTISNGSGTWKVIFRVEQTYYNQGTQKEQLWAFYPGAGEAGTGYSGLHTYGFLDAIESGAWDGGVMMGNGKHWPILCLIEQIPDFPSSSIQEAQIAAVIDNLIARFPVKSTAGKPNVMLTGLSAGGGTAKYLVTSDTYSTTGPWPRANRVTAIADIQGVAWNANKPYPQLIENFARSGGRMASFEGKLDGRGLAATISQMNSVVANSGIYKQLDATTPMQTHCCWNYIYGGDGSGTLYSSPAKFSLDGVNQNIYEWLYRQGDTTFVGGGGGGNLSPTANAGSDQIITLPVDSVSLSGSGSDPDGSIVSYSWQKISGPGTTSIPNPNNQNVKAYDLEEGVYIFRLTVTDNSGGTGTDDVQVTVNPIPSPFNYMTKNVNPCRVGGGQKFTIGNSLISGKVTTTEIFMPYITRDNILGTQVKGGDTLLIKANPNNSGYWKNIELGDFGGSLSCPVVVMADSIVKITDNFRFGIRDSNVVAYTHVNGLANRLSKGVVYGFQNIDQNAFQDTTNIGMTGNLVHHFEVDGVAVVNSEVGMMIKINGDSTNSYKQYNNFSLQNIYVHDFYLRQIHGEATYLGNTDIDGQAQTANQHTKPPAGDTLVVKRGIIINAGWDGIQVSNFNYGNEVSTVALYRTGQRNQSSQQWAAFLGGNSSNILHDCSSYNSTGPIGALGKGVIGIYNNYVDSVWDGRGDADGIYVSMSLSGLPTPVDSLRCYDYNNIIKNVERKAVFHANTSSAMLPGQILSNIYVGNSGVFTSNVTGEQVVDNVSNPSYDVTLIGTDSYRMLKLIRSNQSTLYSYWDLQNGNRGYFRKVLGGKIKVKQAN